MHKLKFRVEIYFEDPETKQKYWKETSRHNNKEYAVANYEVKAKKHVARIKHGNEIIMQSAEVEEDIEDEKALLDKKGRGTTP